MKILFFIEKIESKKQARKAIPEKEKLFLFSLSTFEPGVDRKDFYDDVGGGGGKNFQFFFCFPFSSSLAGSLRHCQKKILFIHKFCCHRMCVRC